MKKIIAVSWTISVMLVFLTCASVDAIDGGCWITGIGTIGCAGDGNPDSSFSGNAMTMKAKAIRGQWTHISLDSEVIFKGDVHYIACKKFPSLSGPKVPKAYPNYANFGGTGNYNGEDGYFFDVKVFDHGESGIYFDRYVIDIYDPDHILVYHADGTGTRNCHSCLDDVKVTPDLVWVLDMGCISSGNIQITPPNAGHPY